MSFLELKNVSKSFGGHAVLKDVNLSLIEGEFVAIVGYSGQGKTTLMSLIAGLTKPDSGEIILEGKPITGPGPDRGLVFQNYSLLPWLTVGENIALAVDSVFPALTAAERSAKVDKHIAMVKLSHAKDRLPRQLSGGMRQRVSVARTLAINPRILLLDEPLSALDALTRANLQDEISQIWQADKKTVVLITNSVDEALLLADRVIPLTLGPGATLAAPITVDLPRPRDRIALNHEPEFKRLRAQITEQLLGYSASRRTHVSRKLVLPDILPEDLDHPRVNRPPRRLSEEKRETVVSI
ncbi:MAG: Bicarbonate transport ATP-binding protein CmpD [Verrucomicrobiota bacterium]|jgi:nitrate/nitrite transport system ATP-binding protein